MPQINRFSSRWIIAIIAAISTAMMFVISAPHVSAKEYVPTTGLSPDGNQYSIGWEVPSIQEPAGRSKRATKDYTFETNQLENGMQTLIHIENSEAPTEYRFPLSLPQGAEVIPFSEGSEDAMGVFLNGSLIATIAAPWAIDANGAPLQTSLHIENGTLVQIVEHNSDTAFPVTADPQIDWGWEKTTIKLNKKETQATGAAGGAGAIAAFPWMTVLDATGPVGLAVLAAAGKLGYDAVRAHRNGKCLGIVVSTNVLSHNGGISTFEYSCA
ncbi:hypothetical protein [Corynebacterium rouxii]|uniref:Uncharacterized protein n=1 Tax=Corynebacterium rouxii TaxID=2719119 RepID=A0A6I8MAV8_9CORY|nr:hypothetical protein [Corynebacterium rouxii]VZH84734.1 hypothetical protein FRC0190_00740 [Corynebacterium rouxii]